MKVFFDTEFIEDGKTIELLSIGLVREDGQTYYAESLEGIDHWNRADSWVKANVISNLKAYIDPSTSGDFLKTKAHISRDIIDFVGNNPEFWAYYADYDWVVLCQLYGRMIDHPVGWPMFCRDIKQLAVDVGNPILPSLVGTEHNALDDAQFNRLAYDFLLEHKKSLR